MDLITDILLNPIYLRGLIGVLLASVLGGVVSLLIRYTQTQFLAIESLHMILAAAATGYLVNLFIPYLYPEAIAYVVMSLFVILIVFLSQRGYEQNISIATIAFVAAAISSLASYGLAVYSPVGPSIVYNILFGSPFFLREQDLLLSFLTILIFLGVLLFTWKKILLLSFDPEYFSYMKGPVSTLLYRTMIYAIVALSAVYVTRLVGAIAAHVLFIAPSITPFLKRITVVSATAIIVLVSVASLILAVILNMPYGGVLGVLSIALYAIPSLLMKK
ncbi:MAG: metal ABC transporter permease [Sulfolobales archaeon]